VGVLRVGDLHGRAHHTDALSEHRQIVLCKISGADHPTRRRYAEPGVVRRVRSAHSTSKVPVTKETRLVYGCGLNEVVNLGQSRNSEKFAPSRCNSISLGRKMAPMSLSYHASVLLSSQGSFRLCVTVDFLSMRGEAKKRGHFWTLPVCGAKANAGVAALVIQRLTPIGRRKGSKKSGKKSVNR